MSKTNHIVEDFLDEDPEIPSQRCVLLSFLSPEKVLNKKELFFFEYFLKSYEVNWTVKNLEKYMVDIVTNVNTQLDARITELEKAEQYDQSEICRKNRLKIDDVMNKYITIRVCQTLPFFILRIIIIYILFFK